MGMSDYGADLMVDALLGIAPLQATFYVALVGEEPEDSDEGADLDEPLDPAYARQPVATGATYWNAAESSTSTFKNDIVFPEATQDWNEIYYWVLCTDATSGQILLWGEFDEGFEVLDTQIATIPAEALAISIEPEEDAIVV